MEENKENMFKTANDLKVTVTKSNGEVVYHNSDPDFHPDLRKLDEMDFDNISYQELMDNYATSKANVEYALPAE